MSKKSTREDLCHVLLDGTVAERVLAFSKGKDGVKPGLVVPVPAGGKVPAKVGARDWQLLIKPRLDVAWMSATDVCIRLVDLPGSDASELGAMVELQLEKISPLPPSQMVAGHELLGEASSGGAAVLVVMAPRPAVEARLEELRGRGFVVDRLDVAMARELVSQAQEDGLWIVLDPMGVPGLLTVAWRTGGRWRQVDVLRIPEGAGAGEVLTASLTRVAWAAELDGWLDGGMPVVRLVSDTSTADLLEPALAAWSGQSVDRRPLRDLAMTAADTAREALAGRALTLMPAETALRNRQAFVDRLWVRGLGTIGMTYLLVALGLLAWLNHQKGTLEENKVNLKSLAQHYTNAMRLRDQVLILEEQVNLRFAALDCWKAAVDKLPASMTLSSMNFVRGKTLRLDGTVEPSAREDVTRYNSELAAVEVRDQKLFGSVKPAQVNTRGTVATWSFEAELNRLDAKEAR
jgi:hypothetical protein